MTASRTTQWLLAGAFLLIIACEGVIQAATELRQGDSIQFLDLVRQSPSQQHLRAFEKELETRAWPAVISRPAMQYVRHSLFDDFGEKALAGRYGWLFYRPDVDFLIQPWPSQHDVAPLADNPLPAMVAFRDELAARGIQLLVVPAPGKPSVYPDNLSSRDVDWTRDTRAHHERLFLQLSDAGIAYVDLYECFANARDVGGGDALYLTQDTHWSPAGLQLAAETVAQRITGEGWLKQGDVEYTTQNVSLPRVGDVLRMVGSYAITTKFEPENVVCGQVLDPNGAVYADDPASPILVLGDSFLRIFQRDEPGAAGFIAPHAREHKQPLTAIVSDGGASTLVRQELQRNPDLLQDKKVVIWEFVERDLRFGMEGWQVVSLPKTPAP